MNKTVLRTGRDSLRYALSFEGILIIGLGLILSLLADRNFLVTGRQILRAAEGQLQRRPQGRGLSAYQVAVRYANGPLMRISASPFQFVSLMPMSSSKWL